MERVKSVESWYFYEEMARRQEYGEVVTPDGKISLMPELEAEAKFFISQLRGSDFVIDVGSGLGFPSLVLAPHVKRLVALDASPTMVSRLHSHIHKLGYNLRMSVILADATALPFGNEQFDGAALSGTLGSLSEPEDFLKELHRVMREGGTVVCIAQNFRHKLQLEESGFLRFCMDNGKLTLRVTEYLSGPYRIRESCYAICDDSKIYQILLTEHPECSTWQAPCTLDLSDLPSDTIMEAICNETIQYDVNGLSDALERAGFQEWCMELRPLFGLQHIFAVFEKK